MEKIITRFAPSPTGMLHIGNMRTALISWLYAKKHNGEFILRIDDTDTVRSKEEYKEALKKDLNWLGITWDKTFEQSTRSQKYEEAREYLIKTGRLYPCFETPEELELKRKLQLSSGNPPIYDRAALNLTESQISELKKQGKKPHYRFLIKDKKIYWNDLIKGDIEYQGANLSDPVIIRADGTMTYMLCSTVDDIDLKISHVTRGEDHVSNTAIQIQMFEALKSRAPTFAHMSLVKSLDSKISKRVGGFDINFLREDGIEAMAVNSLLAFMGSSISPSPCYDIGEIIEKFDTSIYSKSPTVYNLEDLYNINHKLIINYEFRDIRPYLAASQLEDIDEKFWLAVRPNLQKLSDIKEWWNICTKRPEIGQIEDRKLLLVAHDNLPQNITQNTWKEWTSKISAITQKKGKSLFMPLRIALTGKSSGPELSQLLPIIPREEILARLK